MLKEDWRNMKKKPENAEDISPWFDSESTWETPHELIAYNYIKLDVNNPLTVFYFNQRVVEKCIEIEKRILFRTMPYIDKKVTARSRIFAVQMDCELWNYFKFIVSQSAQPDKNTTRTTYFPDHGFYRAEHYETLTWCNRMPKLYHNNWNFKKWVDAKECRLWRALVHELHFTYNSYTQLVRIEFAYRTQLYNDTTKEWEWI
jgi:hypothetical protein